MTYSLRCFCVGPLASPSVGSGERTEEGLPKQVFPKCVSPHHLFNNCALSMRCGPGPMAKCRGKGDARVRIPALQALTSQWEGQITHPKLSQRMLSDLSRSKEAQRSLHGHCGDWARFPRDYRLEVQLRRATDTRQERQTGEGRGQDCHQGWMSNGECWTQ